MVYQSILKLKKRLLIPFTAVTSNFIFSKIAFAEATAPIHLLKGFEYIKPDAVLNKNDDSDKGFFDLWGDIGENIANGINWFNELPSKIGDMSVELLSWSYKIISDVVLYTPLFLFNNSYLRDTTSIFMLISAGLVIIFTILEGLKRILKKQHTDLATVSKKLPIAVAGAGFAPYLFEKSFFLLNQISQMIINLGKSTMTSQDVNLVTDSDLNILALIGFDILLIVTIFQVALHNGKRWFNLIALCALTPLSLSAWIFKDYSHYFSKWWGSVKKLAFTQVIYAFYLFLIGLLIFGTASFNTFTNPAAYFAKLLCIIGGFHSMLHPPTFVNSKLDSGSNGWNMGKEVASQLLMKKFPPLQFFKKAKGKFSNKN